MIKKASVLIALTILVGRLVAGPGVAITRAVQQFPWARTVDIDYTVTGATSYGYYAVFEAKIDNVLVGTWTNELPGTAQSTTTVQSFFTQWNPPSGVDPSASVKITPRLYNSENDYLIVNLSDGAYYYEGMVSQALSNKRYNTDDTANVYKTSKMVFRKVKAGRYTIAGSMEQIVTADALYDGANHQVYFPADYYIAIHRLSQAQYGYITGNFTNSIAGLVNHPTIIRGEAGHTVAAAGPIATLCQRVSSNSANKAKGLPALKIDIPTHAMIKVAHAAGKAVFWADANASVTPTTALLSYIWCKDNNTQEYTRENCPLGKKLPNEWGLYDVSGIDMISVMDQTGNIHYEEEEPKLANNFRPIITRTDYWCFVGGSQAITVAYNNTEGQWPARNTLNANWYSLSNYGQHRLAIYPSAYYPNGGQ